MNYLHYKIINICGKEEGKNWNSLNMNRCTGLMILMESNNGSSISTVQFPCGGNFMATYFLNTTQISKHFNITPAKNTHIQQHLWPSRYTIIPKTVSLCLTSRLNFMTPSIGCPDSMKWIPLYISENPTSFNGCLTSYYSIL